MASRARRKKLTTRKLYRLWAELRFSAMAMRELRGPLLAFALVWALGAVLHWRFGAPVDGAPPSLGMAFFIAFQLLFIEHTGPLPAHPVGVALQYLLPFAGVVVLAEGLIKIGLQVFQKDAQQERWMRVLANSSRGHFILCGLGSVGFRILEELVGMGEQVFVIERNANSDLLPQARALGAEVLIGDARTEDLMRSLNVLGARAVIVATDDDLANMEIAMDVREIRKDIPIVLRLFDQRLAQKVKGSLGISATFSASKMAGPLFAAAALDPHVVGAHRVGDEVLVVMQITVLSGASLAGLTVAEVAARHRLTVLALHDAKGWAAQPAPNATLEAGREAQLLVAGHRTDEVHRLNGAR
jgi:Trk K+ transport system NAD-binding subunit